MKACFVKHGTVLRLSERSLDSI